VGRVLHEYLVFISPFCSTAVFIVFRHVLNSFPPFSVSEPPKKKNHCGLHRLVVRMKKYESKQYGNLK
jgi:hypothetical protein